MMYLSRLGPIACAIVGSVAHDTAPHPATSCGLISTRTGLCVSTEQLGTSQHESCLDTQTMGHGFAFRLFEEALDPSLSAQRPLGSRHAMRRAGCRRGRGRPGHAAWWSESRTPLSSILHAGDGARSPVAIRETSKADRYRTEGAYCLRNSTTTVCQTFTGTLFLVAAL